MIEAAPRSSPFYRLRELFQDALGLAPLTDKRKLLALLLVRRSDESIFARCGELVAWIGADKLAKAMRCDRRTVQRGLHWLLDVGVIEVDRKGGGRARSTRYRFSKQWLGTAALELENCGIAEAYGLPDDLFAYANGGTFAAVAGQYSGMDATHSPGNSGAMGQNSGMAATVSGGNSGASVRMGEMGGVHAAVSGQNCGAFSGGGQETAASGTGNSGNSPGNCGAALPPEIDLNNRNRGARPGQTAAHRQPDRNQGHLPLPFAGGKAASREDGGYSLPVRNERWYSDLVQRAEGLLGDANRAALAVAWLEDGQKQRVRSGLRPSDSDLEKWLGWALDAAAEGGRETAAPGVPDPDDRLARVERQAAETAAEVQSIGASLRELLAVLRPLIPPGQSAAA